MTILKCEALQYQRDSFVLRANIEFQESGRYILLAPSGSGKSTFLDLIAGFINPTQGKIIYRGQILSALPTQKRPLAYLFQNHNLFQHLSVAENLALSKRPRSEQQEALQEVGLPLNYAVKFPHELSGGEQQRVALARALLLKREIVLLDEPFSALDLATKEKICALTLHLQQQFGFLLLAVSHDEHDAKRLAAEVLTIKNQEIIFKD